MKRLIERVWEQQQPLSKPVVLLPQSYLAMVAEQNGGYVKKMRVSTKEPTSDGLDFALLHYLAGLHDVAPYSISHLKYPDLPDYFVVFSANGSQLFAFDYSVVDDSGEPAIRYLDLETDNWQTVAANFTELLENLTPYEMPLPLEDRLTRFEAEHAFLLAEDALRVADLLLHLEAVEEKAWYLEWISHFSRHQDEAVRQAALDALETQVFFFRLRLPGSVRELVQVFMADESVAIRDKAVQVSRELEKDRKL